MDPTLLREGDVEVEVSPHVTPTGPRLRLRSLPGGESLDLDPLELEGLTRLAFVTFPQLHDGPGEIESDFVVGGGADLEILRNEFAMVAVTVEEGPEEGPDGGSLRVRNMGSGAEVVLRAHHLERLVRLHHRDLAPLVDPSGLAAAAEPDPDQV
jgi:hypothetical protein